MKEIHIHTSKVRKWKKKFFFLSSKNICHNIGNLVGSVDDWLIFGVVVGKGLMLVVCER